MSDYIKREDAIKRRHGCQDDCQTCDFAVERDSWCSGNVFVVDIIDIPAANVVERKNGKWILIMSGGGRRATKSWFQCSECGFTNTCRLNYCPECGADMRGDSDV